MNLVVTRPGKRDLNQAPNKAKPVTGGSPHLCRSIRPINPGHGDGAVVAADRPMGELPFPVQRLTPHSLSRPVRDLLAGTSARTGTCPSTPTTNRKHPSPCQSLSAGGVQRDDAQRAWARRRADLQDIADVDDILEQFDARANHLQQRTADILDAETDR